MGGHNRLMSTYVSIYDTFGIDHRIFKVRFGWQHFSKNKKSGINTCAHHLFYVYRMAIYRAIN